MHKSLDCVHFVQSNYVEDYVQNYACTLSHNSTALTKLSGLYQVQ